MVGLEFLPCFLLLSSIHFLRPGQYLFSLLCYLLPAFRSLKLLFQVQLLGLPRQISLFTMGSDNVGEPQAGSKGDIMDEATVAHAEASQEPTKWNAVNSKDRDVAMALFDDPEELHEEIDPAEARRVLWKIDFMILPYLAVCYAFFYIDKVGQRLFLLSF